MMRRAWLARGFSVLSSISVACEGESAADGGVAADGGGDAARAADARTMDSAALDAGPLACESFGFLVTGRSCGTSCAPIRCDCPGSFPASLTSCTEDGCLVGVDCEALCASDLGRALECTAVHRVRVVDASLPPVDTGVPKLANGAACAADDACDSGRCALRAATGTCVAGGPGDPCGDARDCLSGLCEEQACVAWTPLQGGKLGTVGALLDGLSVFDNGYTVAGHGTSVDLGSGVIQGGRAMFLAEYSHAGALQAVMTAAVGSNSTTLHGVRLPDGSRRLAGDFYTSWRAGGSELTTLYNGNLDLFLASYGNDGQLQWARRFGASMSQVQRAEAFAVDAAGASYLSGNGSDIDFGAGAVSGSPFLAKINADGSLAWSHGFDAADGVGQAIAIDASDGSLVWSGVNRGLDDLKLDGTTTAVDGFGIFLARFTKDGAHLWSKGFDSFAAHARVAIAPNRDIVMTGSFRNRTTFGGATFESRNEDVFIARFSPTGEHLWSRAFGGPSADRAQTIAFDSDGSFAIGGFFGTGADFGAGPVPTAGAWDGFVASYAADGTLRKLWFVRGPEEDEVRSVAFTADGLRVGGMYSGTQDFGSGTVTGAGGFTVLLPK